MFSPASGILKASHRVTEGSKNDYTIEKKYRGQEEQETGGERVDIKRRCEAKAARHVKWTPSWPLAKQGWIPLAQVRCLSLHKSDGSIGVVARVELGSIRLDP